MTQILLIESDISQFQLFVRYSTGFNFGTTTLFNYVMSIFMLTIFKFNIFFKPEDLLEPLNKTNSDLVVNLEYSIQLSIQINATKTKVLIFGNISDSE